MDLENKEQLSFLEKQIKKYQDTVTFYHIIRQILEVFCSKIKKYEEYTSEYYQKLFDTDFSINISAESFSFLSNKMIEVSNIYQLLNKVPSLISCQIGKLRKFLENLGIKVNELEKIKKNQCEIFSQQKQEFRKLKAEYEINELKNQELMSKLYDAENEIINFYRDKKEGEEYEKSEKIMEEKIEIAKKKEKDYKNNCKNGENHSLYFYNKVEPIFIKMNNVVQELYGALNENSLNFMILRKNYNSLSCKEIENEINNSKSISDNIKSIVEKFKKVTKIELNEVPLDKFNLRIIDYKKPHSIVSQNTIRKNKIKKNNSNKRLSINSYMNMLEKKRTLKNSKSANRLPVKKTPFKFKKIDIINIVKKMQENFTMINLNGYNIEKEEQKILIKNLTNKLLSIDSKNHKDKNIIISDDDKKYLFSIIDKDENNMIFLKRLNKIRSYGIFEFDKLQFDDIVEILFKILNITQKNKDISSFKLCLILSQTYFYLKEGKKIYLQSVIKYHDIFKSEEIWKASILLLIKEANERFKNFNLEDLSEEERKKRYSENFFGLLLPMVNDMKEFGFDLEKAKKLTANFCDECNIDNESRKILMDTLGN